MQIGFDIRVPQVISEPEALVKVVAAGEDLGFGYMTLGDHLITPIATESDFPYSSDGTRGAASHGARHEMLSTIAFLAAKTSTLRFVAGVVVVPYRPAVLTAKMLATIDVLSGGRLTVGVGTGWMQEEFAVLNAPDFKSRGQVTDEYIDAMKELWTQQEPRFEGEHVQFSGITFEPKPRQIPHPPIWVGGMAKAAIRRVASRGDVWYTVPTDKSRPADSVSRVRQHMEELRAAGEASGRNPDSLSMAMCVLQHGDALPDTASDGGRMLFSGTSSQIAEDLAEVRELGVTAVDFRFGGERVEQAIDEMGTFCAGVLDQI